MLPVSSEDPHGNTVNNALTFNFPSSGDSK